MSANDRKGCQNPPRETWTLRDPQRTPERHGDIQRHLKTPGDTQTHLGGPSARETHFTYNVFFFFLYMFTEWTKFNKLNMILQPFIPTLKVPFFWSMFSLLKQLKTRKEELSTSWLKSELTFMFGAQFTGCCGSWSAACRAESLHHHMEAPHQ